MAEMNLDLERTNILLADGNRHMRAIIKGILHTFGAKNIRETEDGTDALRELRTFPADLVICDLMMEPLNGLDFLRIVRKGKDSPNPYVPVIMLSGHTERHYVMEAVNSGVNEFLAKPISAQSLHRRIYEVFCKPRPFVESPAYFGPERRAEREKIIGHDRRLSATDSLFQFQVNLTPDEMNALLN